MSVIRKKILVCNKGELRPGETRSFEFGGSKGIAFSDEGHVVAYINRCTHMGGPVSPCGGCTLKCSFHGAEFDARTGARVSGEAPEGTFLKPIELVTEDGAIYAILELVDEFD